MTAIQIILGSFGRVLRTLKDFSSPFHSLLQVISVQTQRELFYLFSIQQQKEDKAFNI
jgi:hypothetical protein